MTTNKGGQPPKTFTQEQVAEVSTLAAVLSQEQIADYFGIARSTFAANDSAPNDVNAANLLYQTHYRWIVEWVDSISGDGPYQFDIPTPNVGDNTLVLPGSIEHDPAHAGWIALKAAMNGKVLNPRTSSPISITRIYLEQ